MEEGIMFFCSVASSSTMTRKGAEAKNRPLFQQPEVFSWKTTATCEKPKHGTATVTVREFGIAASVSRVAATITLF